MKEKIKNFLKKAVLFIANPRLLLCFGLGWMITNGWSYIMLALGSWLQIGWMVALSGAYLTFLWLPISPEKIVTVAIAMFLLKVLFPNDEKTLGVLKAMYAKLKAAVAVKKEQRKQRKEEKNDEHQSTEEK
jgi:hypothetical protein